MIVKRRLEALLDQAPIGPVIVCEPIQRLIVTCNSTPVAAPVTATKIANPKKQ
jgi:hypothetical protein